MVLSVITTQSLITRAAACQQAQAQLLCQLCHCITRQGQVRHLNEDGVEAASATLREAFPFLAETVTDAESGKLFQKMLERMHPTERS